MDGTILVADWYDPGVGGHGMGDERCYGRILRIAPKGHSPRATGNWRTRDVGFVRVDESAARRAELAELRARSVEVEAPEFLRLARDYDGRDRVYLEAFGRACEGKEDAVYPLLEEELGDAPSEWDARFAGLAWRLHPPRALPAFVERAMDAALPSSARKQALDAIAFMKTREAAEAMANLAAASPEDLRPYARWWLENRATNDWAGWVDRAAIGGGLADAELVWQSGVVRAGTYEVDLDVSGATKLWLVVSEGEHGIDYDWADWLAPRFERAGKTTKLLDLDWLDARSGWGASYEGKNCEGGPLVVERKKHTDGIGTHARSEIAYAVPAGAERFRATAAPDDMGSKREGSTNELEFQVWLERPPTRERLEQLVAHAFGMRSPEDERSDALRELALDPEGGLVLIERAERTQLTAEQRAIVAERIFQNPDLGVRARASALFRRAGERPRPSVEALLALPGDVGWGRDLFLDPRAQCSICHAFELGGRRRGGDLGPELTGVRTKLDAARLFDAILNPSAEIAHGFETWRVETVEGELVAGFLLADGPTLILEDTQGKRHAFAADEVAERREEKVSVMPDGVAAGLDDQELADLVAFLRDDPAREPRFGPEIELFDGKSFSGWTFHLDAPGAKLADVWSVRDGAIVCKGEPYGYLRTEAEYTNFELVLEWRFDPTIGPGNSGVLLRKVGNEKVWPKSIEAQLQHRNAGDIWNIDEFPMAVDAERTDGRRTARRAPCSEKPPGEWNRYRIRLDRDALTLEVNGVRQNTASWCQEVSGPICLQSEGAAIEFRNVRLRPILN
jgi:putative heme-binding domain-containing protein